MEMFKTKFSKKKIIKRFIFIKTIYDIGIKVSV